MQRRWENLVQAHETLQNKDKYKNWKDYGHPDGAMTVKAVELMLPTIFTDKAMVPFWLTLAFIMMVAIVLGTITW